MNRLASARAAALFLAVPITGLLLIWVIVRFGNSLSRSELVVVLVLIAIASLGHVALYRSQRRFLAEQAQNADLVSLHSALDQIDIGVALIDADLRARFVNHAYRRIFCVPEAMAASKPRLQDLLAHKFDQRVYEIATDKATYIKDRLNRIQSGDDSPLDLRLVNGEVIRFRSKALADGGWMLNYGNVSDLVRVADELAELATVDSLTGTFNRRYFFSKLETEWKRHRRYDRPLSLLMLDIDNFKPINDRFGHDVGDQVIARVAAICLDCKRDSDVLARLGGEEFTLLLPETSLSDARVVAERVRRAVASENWSAIAALERMTVSIGVAAANAQIDRSAELIRLADKAMYVAKRAGRNRIAAASAEGKIPLDATAA